MSSALRTKRDSVWFAELCVVVALAALTTAGIWIITNGASRVAYDTFRDMAWSENILVGNVWSDPTLQNEPFWYAPGIPLLFSSLARLTGSTIPDVYRLSVLWLNGLIPVLFYLAVRLSTDRLTALIAIPLVGLGSLWWLTQFAAPIPSVQGVLLNLTCLILVQRFAQISGDSCSQRPRRPLLFGLVLGILLAASAWIHPLCATLAGGAIGLQIVHGSFQPWRTGEKNGATSRLDRSNWRKFAIGAVTSGFLLSLPLLLHFIFLPQQNSVPFRYFANELSDPNFALQLHAPLVPMLGAVGAWLIVRSHSRAIWVIGYLTVGLVGQAAGYFNYFLRIRVPFLLPHEFQWHTQLAVGVCAAVGISGISMYLAKRISWPAEVWLARVLWVGLFFVAALTPALPYVKFAGSYLIDVTELSKRRRETTAWIRNHTSIEDVFACRPDEAYLILAGLTGRKCVAVPVGHMNPCSNAAQRLADLDFMLEAQDEGEFSLLSARYGVKYLVLIVRSPTDANRIQLLFNWPSLIPVFSSPAEQVVIFAIASAD